MAKTKKKVTKKIPKKATKKKPPRRKFKVETVTLKLSEALGHPGDLDDLRDDMTEWRDNLESGGLEHTDKYQAVSEAADALESICSEMESACEALLEALKDHPVLDIEIDVSTMRPYGRSPARWLRLENATSPVQAALGKLCVEIPEPTKGEETKENEIYEALEDVQSQLDECRNVSFPGMYG